MSIPEHHISHCHVMTRDDTRGHLLNISVRRQKGAPVIVRNSYRTPEAMNNKVSRIDPAVHGPLGNIQILGEALNGPEGPIFGLRLSWHGHRSSHLGRGI